MFQFQYGTIGSEELHNVANMAKIFQFQYGTIGSTIGNATAIELS